LRDLEVKKTSKTIMSFKKVSKRNLKGGIEEKEKVKTKEKKKRRKKHEKKKE
jgi:hypothetical protein